MVARVGGIDMAHYEIDPEHSAEAGKLLKLIVAWLKRRDDTTGLARVLQTIPPPVLEQKEPGAAAQSRAEAAVAAEGQPYIVVHEAPRNCGIGAEIAATVAEHGLYDLQAPIQRVTGYDTVMPLSRLEYDYIPSIARITDAVRETLAE